MKINIWLALQIPTNNTRLESAEPIVAPIVHLALALTIRTPE
jgi:hypothetical protein